MVTKQAFGAAVKALREAKGLSQAAFGELAGLDQARLSLLERGKANVMLHEIDRLAATSGLAASELLAMAEQSGTDLPEIIAGLQQLDPEQRDHLKVLLKGFAAPNRGYQSDIREETPRLPARQSHWR